MRLPSTLIFDHPTVRQLVRVFDSAASTRAPHAAAACAAMAPHAEGVIVACAKSLLPQTVSADAAWPLVAGGCDALGEVPSSRWPFDERTRALAHRVPAMQYGGFLKSVQLFDNGFFSISPAEAAVMDPQQRLLLEHAYAALHGASQSKPLLMGACVGVYIGVWACEYQSVLNTIPTGQSVYAATAATCSVVVGRVSFVLGMQGPCVSVDTACSSSLAALHGGARALQHAECTTALVAGVNML